MDLAFIKARLDKVMWVQSHKLGEVLQFPATLILDALAIDEGKKGRVSLDCILFAQILVDSAVRLGNRYRGIVLILPPELLPYGCKLFAMAAPWCVELDKGHGSSAVKDSHFVRYMVASANNREMHGRGYPRSWQHLQSR